MMLLGLLAWGVGSAWSSDVDASGYATVDLRVRLTDLPAGAWYAPAGRRAGVERSKAIAGGEVFVRTGQWSTTAAGRVEALDGSTADALVPLTVPERVMPVRVRLDELTLELWDVLFPGLDVTLGHQTVMWGVGDQFNPTNTLNASDLEDPLQFGMKLPNTMVRLDYALGPMWTLSAVGVPVFRPATLPATAALGPAFVGRMPMVEDNLRRELQDAQAFSRDSTRTPTIVRSTSVAYPGRGLENAQGMVRLGGSVGMQDVALSWYTGRSDIPQPIANHTERVTQRVCHPVRTGDCINGYLLTDATMAYPRMHVAGFNAAGEINPLGFVGAHPLGWRFELAVIQPERLTVAITNGDLDLGDGLVQPAGEYDYDLDGERPTVIRNEAFAKWTLGLDYTFGDALYVNAQWVHGMVDEFGAGDFLSPGYVTRAGDADWEMRRMRVGDYLVVGTDILLGGPTLRIFSLTDLSGYRYEDTSSGEVRVTNHSPFSEDGFSAVVYPELIVPFEGGLSMNVGVVNMLGKDHTKFGDPAAGGTVAFMKVNHRF